MFDLRDLKSSLRITVKLFLEEGYSPEDVLVVLEEIQREEPFLQENSHQAQIPVTGVARISVAKDISFFPDRNMVVFADQSIFLSAQESKLFFAFLMNEEEVVSHKYLCKAINDKKEVKDPKGLVRVVVHRLRNKISAVPNLASWIKSVRGRGYYFSRD